MVCFVFTGLAIVFAFLDVAGVQRQAREQQRELLESLEATFDSSDAGKHTPRAKGWVDGVKKFWSKVTA